MLFKKSKKRIVAELEAQYAAEFKRITGESPDDLLPINIADDNMYYQVKMARDLYMQEAKALGVADMIKWAR